MSREHARLPLTREPLGPHPTRVHGTADPGQAYHEVYAYATTRPAFLLQHVVDAHAAQTATPETKPIALLFALVGLYLRVEGGRSGSEVQRVHRLLAKQKCAWPVIPLPADRGSVSAGDVLAAAPGEQRDAAVDLWCRSVWDAFRESRACIVGVLASRGIT